MSEPFIKYEIIDDKGVIYDFTTHDDVWSFWHKWTNNKFTRQPETFGDVKLVKVVAISYQP